MADTMQEMETNKDAAQRLFLSIYTAPEKRLEKGRHCRRPIGLLFKTGPSAVLMSRQA
jgi:hypothetical protein